MNLYNTEATGDNLWTFMSEYSFESIRVYHREKLKLYYIFDQEVWRKKCVEGNPKLTFCICLCVYRHVRLCTLHCRQDPVG